MIASNAAEEAHMALSEVVVENMLIHALAFGREVLLAASYTANLYYLFVILPLPRYSL